MSDTPRADVIRDVAICRLVQLEDARRFYDAEDFNRAIALAQNLERELDNVEQARRAWMKLADERAIQAADREILARENAALRYVVEKAAEWDPENTDSADLAALGAYARAALTPAHTDHPSRHYDRTCPACAESAGCTSENKT